MRRLFNANFGRGPVGLEDHDVLRNVARSVGLPEGITDEVLGSDEYGKAVRADEAAPRSSM